MKILHLDTERTWRGGEQQVTYLVRGLMARGHACLLAAPPDAEILRRFAADGIPTAAIDMRGEADPGAVFRLARLMGRERPDIVHMHTAHAHTLGVAASVMARTGRRVVSRRVDFAIRSPASRLKYRVGVDRFVAITRAVADVLIDGGVSRDRISIVHSGIDPARLAGADGSAGREKLGFSGETPLVGCVAHHAWHKGLEYLVRAWPHVCEHLPEARLVLVGQGKDTPVLEEEARAAGVTDVIRFAGYRSDVPDCLAALDVFVLPSVLEGLGTSILDALTLRVPVVASEVGGIPEIITDGETGLLVPPREPERLAEAIVRMLTDGELARRTAEAGRQRVADGFTTEHMVEGTLGAYAQVLDGHAAPSTTSQGRGG